MRALALAALVCALPAQQPQVRLERPSPSTVRLGESCTAKLRVFNASDAEPRVPLVRGAIVQIGGPQSVRSSVNGRLTVYTQFDLRITPQQVGKVTIPGFAVMVGGRELQTEPFTVEAVRDLRGKDRGFLRVEASSTRVYVNEPLRVRVDFGVDASLEIGVRGYTPAREKVYDVEIVAPWLEEIEGATSLDVPDLEKSLLIVHGGQAMQVAYSDLEEGGRTFHRFQFERAFLPERPGVLELAAPTLRFKVLTGPSRVGFFGERVSGREENLFVYGEPMRVEVLPLPKEGRPAGYSGAVGRFTMRASLDRASVKVGSSVKVSLTIEGLGNLGSFAVPELVVGEGLHLLGKTENRGPDRVEVTYDLTPLNADVREVPAVEWSYFDTSPGAGLYRTLRTDPLPLRVEALAENESLAALPGEESGAVVPGVDDIFDIMPAADGDVPMPEPLPRGFAGLVFAVPWLVALAVVGWLGARRRRAADVAGLRARGAGKRFKAALAQGGDPRAALVSYLAERLGVEDAAMIGPDLPERLREAGVPDELADPVRSEVEAGVAARYGGGGAPDPERVVGLVDRLERVDLRRIGALFVALLALCASGVAQEAAPAVAAYRAGDYATASERFAEAAARRPDAATLYNLGNSLYREGELGRALVAWERARLALPRDPSINANLALVRAKLDLGRGEGEPFLQAVAALRDRFTARELFGIGLALHLFAAFFLVLGGRRRGLRVAGVLLLIAALVVSLEVLWWGPSRPPRGIVIAARAELVAEPRQGLEALMKLKEGVAVEVLGEGPQWTQVRVRERSGYLPSAAVGVVR